MQADGAKGPLTSRQARTTTRTDANGHDERWWKARVRSLVEKLDRATQRLQIARAHAAAISAEMNRSGTRDRTATRRAQNAAAEIDRRAVDVVNARRALEDLEEEARVAGAVPGWLRQ